MPPYYFSPLYTTISQDLLNNILNEETPPCPENEFCNEGDITHESDFPPAETLTTVSASGLTQIPQVVYWIPTSAQSVVVGGQAIELEKHDAPECKLVSQDTQDNTITKKFECDDEIIAFEFSYEEVDQIRMIVSGYTLATAPNVFVAGTPIFASAL